MQNDDKTTAVQMYKKWVSHFPVELYQDAEHPLDGHFAEVPTVNS